MIEAVTRLWMAGLCFLLAYLLESRYNGPIDWPLTGVIRLFWPEHREKFNEKLRDQPDPLARVIRYFLVVAGIVILVVPL